MTVLRLVLLIFLGAVTAMCQQNSPQKTPKPPASCPVTVPPANPFTPPAPYGGDTEKAFSFGTERLWTYLRRSGVWWWTPHGAGHEHQIQPLTDKIFWMSVDFNWEKEDYPGLTVTGRRLDGDAPPLLKLPTTNVIGRDSAAMLTGVYVPTPGCWEITGEYKGEKLSFVVWVQPVKPTQQGNQ